MGYDVPPGFRQVDAQSFCHAVVDGTHASPKQAAAGRRLVTSKHIKNGRVDLSTAYLISEADFQEINRRSRVDQWDVIFTMIGTIGESALVVDEAPDFAIKNVGLFKSRDELSGRWLYYFLQAPEARAELDHRKKGSTQQYISLGDLRSFPLLVPLERDTTQSIVSILQSFDDRIDLLRQTNVTLEAIAQALFKSWFVDFDPVHAKVKGREPEGMDAATVALFPSEWADSELGFVPEGWRVTSLGEAFEINPKRVLKRGEQAKYLDMASAPTSGHVPIMPIDRTFTSGSKFKNGDTLLARITPCLENGKTAHVDFLESDGIGWGSTEFIVLRPRKPLPPYFGYLLSRLDSFRAFAIQSMTGSSGRQRVRVDRLKQFPLVLPGDEIVECFGRVVEPLRESIFANARRTEMLANIRDTLLPRLISGKLRLPEAKREIEAATE